MRILAGQSFDHRPREEFESNHRRNGVSWQSEEIPRLFAFTKSTLAKHNRPARLDFRPRKKEMRAHLRQHSFDEIVFTHGNSAGEQKQIRFQSVLDKPAQGLWFVGRNRQQNGVSARGEYLRGERITI